MILENDILHQIVEVENLFDDNCNLERLQKRVFFLQLGLAIAYLVLSYPIIMALWITSVFALTAVISQTRAQIATNKSRMIKIISELKAHEECNMSNALKEKYKAACFMTRL
jgi:hypothetical protein